MERGQKLYYLLVGFFAFTAFAIGFGLSDVRQTLAQSNCGLGAGDDWCATWTVAKWLTSSDLRPISVEGSIGPADWLVSGVARINGAGTNFTENWSLSKVQLSYKNNVREDNTIVKTLIRDIDSFKQNLSPVEQALATANFVTTGYGPGSPEFRWNPGNYMQIRWAADGDADNSKIRTWYPTEWKVTGRFQ